MTAPHYSGAISVIDHTSKGQPFYPCGQNGDRHNCSENLKGSVGVKYAHTESNMQIMRGRYNLLSEIYTQIRI